MLKWWFVVLGLISTVLIASGSSGSHGFSERSLKGGYGCILSGFQLQDPPLDPDFVWNLGNAVPGTLLFQMQSNGKGGLSLVFDFNVGGRFARVFGDGPLPAAYSVSPDGTGAIDGGFYTFDFVLTDRGSGLYFQTASLFPSGNAVQRPVVDRGVCRRQ